jgi:hypothetical protein
MCYHVTFFISGPIFRLVTGLRTNPRGAASCTLAKLRTPDLSRIKTAASQIRQFLIFFDLRAKINFQPVPHRMRQ